MELTTLISIILLLLATLSACLVVYFVYARPRADLRALMGSSAMTNGRVSELRKRLEEDETGEEYEKVKSVVRSRRTKKKEPTLEEKMFRAGIFTDKQKKDYRRVQIFLPIVATVVFIVLSLVLLPVEVLIYSVMLGPLIGMYFPLKLLAKMQATRDEDILYYLPLVIEELAIGVSSSLDVGPCLAQVVEMADERGCHNPVTEMIRYAQFHMRSGVGMEEALLDVGNLSGHPELKHTFMALAQVSKFGGEVSRQLQELADSVSAQREAKIDEKIKKLELIATGPLTLVFASYLVLLLVSFGLQIVTKI